MTDVVNARRRIESKTSGQPSLLTLVTTSRRFHVLHPAAILLFYQAMSTFTCLHAAGETLLALGLALHLLADLDVDLEELAHAAVEADGLALVEVGFAVRCVDAFRGAGLEETRSKNVSRRVAG